VPAKAVVVRTPLVGPAVDAKHPRAFASHRLPRTAAHGDLGA
jgi:hypothetical protein